MVWRGGACGGGMPRNKLSFVITVIAVRIDR